MAKETASPHRAGGRVVGSMSGYSRVNSSDRMVIRHLFVKVSQVWIKLTVELRIVI